MIPLSLEVKLASVVILSSSNNPRILNPDFLVNNGIVPSAWEVAQVLVLPPVSLVAFSNGIQITLEESKLTIEASGAMSTDWRSELPRIACGFISTLHHVSYNAAGINFAVLDTSADVADKFARFRSQLVKADGWLPGGGEGVVDQIRVRRTVGDKVMLTFQAEVTITKMTDMPHGRQDYKFSANFHKEFTPLDKDSRIAFIKLMPDYCNQVYDIIEQLPLYT